MDNKQKRKFMSLIYRTIIFCSIIAIITTIYVSIDKLINPSLVNINWLNTIAIIISAAVGILIISDIITTKKISNKYAIANIFFFIFMATFIGLITLAIYMYITKIDFLLYSQYFLPIGLIIITELFFIINFILGIKISKLNKSTTITIDSVAETPNFDDELQLKKKLDELNRKLAMKKVQEQIDAVEKELDK